MTNEEKRAVAKREVDRIIRETPRQISMEMYARAVAFEAYATGWNLRAELAQKDVEAERSQIVAELEQEDNVVREITKTANEAEQAAAIRTAAEALMEYVEKIPSKLPLMEHRDARFIAGIIERGADLKVALSRGWLARKEPNSMCECGVSLYLHGSLTACCLPRMTTDD